MADPLTLLGIGSTVVGGLGSLFGSGSKTEIPPELQQVYDMVLKQAQEGLSDEAVNAMIMRAKTGLGQEAGALGALTESRLTRAGAGTGVQQAALNRINKQRLLGIGEATTSAMLADEEAKQRGLQQLGQLAPLFGEFTTETGQGFADLFGSGLGFLLNRPQGIQQLGQGQNPIQQGINEFLHPQTPAGRPNVRNEPFKLQFPGG
jgi:hypothetical protein